MRKAVKFGLRALGLAGGGGVGLALGSAKLPFWPFESWQDFVMVAPVSRAVTPTLLGGLLWLNR